MRALVLLVAVGLSAGSATSYQQSFREARIAERRWMVTVEVNTHTSSTVAMEYAYRRAAELCPRGFTPLQSHGTRDSRTGIAYDPQTRKWSNPVHDAGATVLLIVDCH